MLYRSFTLLFVVLALASLACGLASPASGVPVTVPVQEATLAPTASIPELTGQQLKNAQYQLGARDDHPVIQMIDGLYQQGTDPASVEYASVAATDFISFGDLTGDGVNEGAALVFENYGGTGSFGFLAIYANVNGLPVFLTSTMIDDRPIINNMSIRDGEIFLDATVHGFDDPGCCPMLATTRRYALVNNQLRLTNYTTAAADGVQRVLEISSPANGTEVSDAVQMTGSISIAPFENNLSYFIYDEMGNQLAAGPVNVTAPDFGAPGTFDQSISLADIPANTIVYLDIQDLSAADGTILALDAVKLTVK
ncbi:MAG: hypothetical protein K8S20_02440 [Chloroflexi bacterium]|nr:hypothetical protein [Chloroflexota bacterium]